MPRCRPANAWHNMSSKSSSRWSSAIATAAAMRSDLFSLPAWAARRRRGRPALRVGRPQVGDAARAEGQERQAASLLPIVERAGLVADLGIKLHAHMLRHSTGYNDALMMLWLNMADPTS